MNKPTSTPVAAPFDPLDMSNYGLEKLREIAGYAKLDSAVEWILDYCEQGEKLVVFAHNRKVIEQVKAKLAA